MKILNCLKAIAGAIKALVKRIYINPVTAPAVATQQIIEVNTVTDTTGTTTAAQTPADEAKEGVKDFDAAVEFIKVGIEHLGAAAIDELKELAKKYL